MEPLERRIARLTPQQQEEVSDFVDFLLLKNNMQQNAAASRSSVIMVNTPPVMVPDATMQPFPLPQVSPDPSAGIPATAAPLILAEESPAPHFEISHGSDDGITRDYLDYGQFDPGQPRRSGQTENRDGQKHTRREEREKTRHILEWVD